MPKQVTAVHVSQKEHPKKFNDVKIQVQKKRTRPRFKKPFLPKDENTTINLGSVI